MKEKIHKLLLYQFTKEQMNVLKVVGLVIGASVLFLFNAEAIPFTNSNMDSFFLWMGRESFWSSYTTLCFLGVMVYCLVGNLFVSYVIMEVVTLAWGIANRVTIVTRGLFISVNELQIINEAKKVNIDIFALYKPIWAILALLGILTGVMLYKVYYVHIHEMVKQKLWKKRMLLVRGTGILASAVIFVGIHGKPIDIFLEKVTPMQDVGTVVWFCQSLFDNATSDISYEEVQEICNGFGELIGKEEVIQENAENRPNVIVIMSEAFWDVGHLQGVVESSENPMEGFYRLAEESVSGQVAVNVYGGGTNVPEFEFITGLNTKYLSGAPNQYVKTDGSMVSYMKALGYYTMAMHPYDGDFWDRYGTYETLGFDVFYTEKEFRNRGMCHGYLSDKSMTTEIIERFEEQKKATPKQPVFTFAVSVQNHVVDLNDIDEESMKDGCSGIETTILGTTPDQAVIEDVEEYYNGLRESVEALTALINYFEAYEEETVIVFFGDHAPSFIQMICETAGKEQEMCLYRTPYLIWSNVERAEKDYGDVNLCYLSAAMLEYAQMPKNGQYYLNRYMLEYMPIDTEYEQYRKETIDSARIIDMLNVMSYINKHYPEEEKALPLWKVGN